MAEIRSARRLMEDYQRHIEQLTELRTLLEERLSAARAELDRLAGPLGADTVPGQAGDAVLSAVRRGRSAEDRIRRLHRDIAAIESAIERMDLGRYGICRRCDAFISLGELRRAPQVQECASCRGPARMTA